MGTKVKQRSWDILVSEKNILDCQYVMEILEEDFYPHEEILNFCSSLNNAISFNIKDQFWSERNEEIAIKILLFRKN